MVTGKELVADVGLNPLTDTHSMIIIILVPGSVCVPVLNCLVIPVPFCMHMYYYNMVQPLMACVLQ